MFRFQASSHQYHSLLNNQPNQLKCQIFRQLTHHQVKWVCRTKLVHLRFLLTENNTRTKIPSKPKNYQHTPKTQKLTKNTPKVQKMTKIPSKPKNHQNTPQNTKNDRNTPETNKMTKIPPKPKNYWNRHPKNDEYPWNLKDDQNTLQIKKMTKIPLET